MTLCTPQTHPDHAVVGYYWKGWNDQVYFCDSYDPALGYWMTNALDPTDRRNVSERAIGRTFHNVRFGQWKAHEVAAAEPHYLVDTRERATGFEPREVSLDVARAAEWPAAVFVTPHDAAYFAGCLRRAATVPVAS